MSRVKKFTDYLEVVGFEQAPFAWHLSKLDIDDHYQIVDALKGVEVESLDTV